MPLYQYRCLHGCWQDTYLSLSQFHEVQFCLMHGLPMERVIGAPLTVKVAPDLCYDSPVDGRPITSHQARIEDLARNGCIPYDPDMKQDVERRHQERQATLERNLDETVEARIAKMSTKQRGQLWNELTRQGADLEYSRATKET